MHLGGALGIDPGFGRKVRARKVRAHKVRGDEVADYVVRVVSNYKDDRASGESFRDWVLHADEELLK